MGWCRTEGNKVEWDGGSEPPVVPTRWALLGVALGGAPVGLCGGGAGFTEGSVGRRPPCYMIIYLRGHYLRGHYLRGHYLHGSFVLILL